MSEYQEAMQHPRYAFADAELQGGECTVTPIGLPRPFCGAFASVYELRTSQRTWAVRCFLQDFHDLQVRYGHIAHALRKAKLSCTVAFDYLPKGICINKQWFPLLKMEWIRGKPLNTYVRECLGKPSALWKLAEAWQRTLEELRQANIAHGDLQHGNVLVDQAEKLKLIDYDGMWVPALTGCGSHECGHRHYQLPTRTGADFGPSMDDFAGRVISLAIRVAATDPDLWKRFDSGENMLFLQPDFVEPNSSSLFGAIHKIQHPDIQRDLAVLRKLLNAAPSATIIVNHGKQAGLPAWMLPACAASAVSGHGQWTFSYRVEWTRPGVGPVHKKQEVPVYSQREVFKEEPVFKWQEEFGWEPYFEEEVVVRRVTRMKKCVESVKVRATEVRTEGMSGFLERMREYFMGQREIELTRTYEVPDGWEEVREVKKHEKHRWVSKGKKQVQIDTKRVSAGYETYISGQREVEVVVHELLRPHQKQLTSVAISGDGESVASVDESGTVCVWKSLGGGLLWCKKLRRAGRVCAVGAERFAISGWDRTVSLVHATQGCIHNWTNNEDSRFYDVAASPDGRFVAAVIGKMATFVWDSQTHKQVRRFESHRRMVTRVIYSPSGANLVTGSKDMQVRVWSTKNWECRAVLQGHTADITAIAASGDGQWIASAGADESLILWETRTFNLVSRVPTPGFVVQSLSFNPCGTHIVGACSDGCLRVWDRSTLLATRTERPLGAEGLICMAPDWKSQRWVIASDRRVALWSMDFT